MLANYIAWMRAPASHVFVVLAMGALLILIGLMDERKR